MESTNDTISIRNDYTVFIYSDLMEGKQSREVVSLQALF